MHVALLQSDSPSGGGYSTLIFVGLMLVVMYFFVIRPQQRRQKQRKKYTESLQAGDDIITLGGIHGKIISLTKDTLTVEVDKGTKIIIERNSVSHEPIRR